MQPTLTFLLFASNVEFERPLGMLMAGPPLRRKGGPAAKRSVGRVARVGVGSVGRHQDYPAW